jgi:hypothetical protein
MSPDLCPFPPSRASIPSFSIPLAGGASQFPASRGPVVSRRDHLPRPRASIPSIFHPSRGFSASRGFRWPAAPRSSLDPLVPVAGGAPQFTESRGFRWRPAASPHLPVLFSRRKASPDLDFTEKSKVPFECVCDFPAIFVCAYFRVVSKDFRSVQLISSLCPLQTI